MQLCAADIAKYCSGELLAGSPDAVISGLTWDSRTVTPRCLYVALPGDRVDGHDFCLDAVRSGAGAVLVSRELAAPVLSALNDAGACAVRVENTSHALTELARAWRGHLQGKVIAITGSSGKTTTKNLVRDVLAAQGSVVATAGNQNNELGVPATLLAAEEHTDFVVVEMGMRGLGQISALCDFVRPDAALVTNVGTSHMELLGSREAIAQAKAEVFETLSAESGVAFLNIHEDMIAELQQFGALKERGITTWYFDATGEQGSLATGEVAQVWASNISFDAAGCPSFELHVPHTSAPCTLQLAGKHNVSNALAAAAVGSYFGMEAASIAAALESSVPEAGRQAIVHAKNGALIIDDSYNANPDSTCASLETFAAMEVEGRRIAVLGDMLELGAYETPGHVLVGHKAAQCKIDHLLCVGTRSQNIALAAEEGGMASSAITCVANAEEALAYVKDILTANDAILVKASHSIGLDAVVCGLVN